MSREIDLNAILKEQGRKKRWLAEKMATTETTVGRWCKSGRIPQIKIERLREVLGVEL